MLKALMDGYFDEVADYGEYQVDRSADFKELWQEDTEDAIALVVLTIVLWPYVAHVLRVEYLKDKAKEAEK